VHRREGSKVHLAVDTLGHLLALHVTPADDQDRAQVAALAQAVQEATGGSVGLAFVDQGYKGEQPATEAASHAIRLEVVKLADAKRGFVLLPRRWVVERSFGWTARFRRLARDYFAKIGSFICRMTAGSWASRVGAWTRGVIHKRHASPCDGRRVVRIHRSEQSGREERSTVAVVLGIDAAWTPGHPSGVALLRLQESGWTCLAVAPSYDAFVALARDEPVDWGRRFHGSIPDAQRLLGATERLSGGEYPAVVAVDMPLAMTPIVGRRRADDQVSREFGSRQCGTHSPTRERPGGVGSSLLAGFMGAGYPLATTVTEPGTAPRVVEVYPHTTLLTLLSANRRVPYKVAKTRRYWPALDATARRERVTVELCRTLEGLRRHIAGIPLTAADFGRSPTMAGLKTLEDALDALVCGWVAVEYLGGRVRPLGDDTAAIWVPEPPSGVS
jgi:predicted RNase H-like nuclease/transposase